MRSLLILSLLFLAGCKSSPPPEPAPGVHINVPGVSVNVQDQDNGGVQVYDPTSRSGVPTVVVPGR